MEECPKSAEGLAYDPSTLKHREVEWTSSRWCIRIGETTAAHLPN